MNWQKVRIIAARELRDQLRDRRTLFVIAVLPLLLYPLLGMAMMQITQFLKEHASVIWVIGQPPGGDAPTLVADGKFVESLFESTRQASLVQWMDQPAGLHLSGTREEQIRQALDSGKIDAVVVFPEKWEPAATPSPTPSPETSAAEATKAADAARPSAGVYYHQAKDRSRIGMDRITRILARWRQQWADRRLAEQDISRTVFEPFVVSPQDVSESSSRHAVLWSRFLPFVLIIWALTGAFYPAIDVCAGEKERGTLETLLSSPARREEIVWGKLITVMFFSMGTSALNLLCMVCTGLFVVHRMSSLGATNSFTAIGTPPVSVMFWMLFALPPLSALFSALAIALAAMARSTKEGQYYLIPLMVVSMPLMTLPVLPSVELDLGNSLIPLTGVVLLLRSLIEGEYLLALKYILPVSAVTALACWMAIRWAVSQFNDEDVLFREGEQFHLGWWLVHLVRDRQATPTVAGAFLAATLMLVVRFFSMFVMPAPGNWAQFVWVALASQLMVVGPVLIMAILLTRSLKRTFLFQWTPPVSVAIAVALAFAIHPLASTVGVWIQWIYPLSDQARLQMASLEKAFSDAPGFMEQVLVLAVIPAICEELAFRGFVLSGMRHLGHRWLAILLTSIFFGLAHPILQQSLSATLLGLVLGYLAVQTSSLWPCIAFHMTHNALQFARAQLLQWTLEAPGNHWLWGLPAEGTLPGQVPYAWHWVLASVLLTVWCLRWFHNLPSQPTPEERLQNSVDQSSQLPAATA